MTRLLACVFLLTSMLTCGPCEASVSTRETVLIVREAERQVEGFGQLDCKGLNRANALGIVIEAKYGRPDFLFAPDPGPRWDGAGSFDFLRPLATIEPSAVRFGRPVDADTPHADVHRLLDAILSTDKANATVLVAWDRFLVRGIVMEIASALGSDVDVGEWRHDDFDSIWRLTIERQDGHVRLSFAKDREGLDGLSDTCPK